MSRKLTTVVATMVVVFSLSVPLTAWAAGEASSIERPQDLATLKNLCYPGLSYPVMVELDAGMLSMLRPLLAQALQGTAPLPEPLADLTGALKKMGPETREALMELLESIKGVAVTVQTPRSGEINVPKVSSFYLQRALAAGWKQWVGISQDPKQSIALFQLPTPVAAGADAEPPQGLLLTVVTPQQVIAAGLLGQLDLGKLLPLIGVLGKR